MKKLTVFMMVILLIMPLKSCKTTSNKETVIIPELVFPIFPKLGECKRTDDGVIVNEEFLVRLAEYKIQIEETEKNYNDIKSLYDNKDLGGSYE